MYFSDYFFLQSTLRILIRKCANFKNCCKQFLPSVWEYITNFFIGLVGVGRVRCLWLLVMLVGSGIVTLSRKKDRLVNMFKLVKLFFKWVLVQEWFLTSVTWLLLKSLWYFHEFVYICTEFVLNIYTTR